MTNATLDLKNNPISSIRSITTHRQIAIPELSDSEELEAELWYDFHRKVKPLWMWLTNSNLYVQTKKPIALTEDRTVSQIPIHRIREIRISTFDLFVQRVIGFSMIAIGTVIALAALQELTSELNRVNWEHAFKYLFLFIAVGITLTLGATKLSITVHYTTNEGKERAYRYRTPFIISNHLREIIFVHAASLSAWAQQKGIKVSVSDSIKTYWKRKENNSRNFLSQGRHSKLARAFQLAPPFSLKPYIPMVIIVVFIAACTGVMLDDSLSTKDAAETKIVLSILSVVLIISIFIPLWLRRRATLKSLAKFNKVVAASRIYPGIITSTRPTMAAVLYDPGIVKIVWCSELDTYSNQSLSTGSRLSFMIDSSQPYRLLPYAEKVITGTESLNEISAVRWSTLKAAIDHIPVKSAPGLYVANEDDASFYRAGMLSNTHSKSLR